MQQKIFWTRKKGQAVYVGAKYGGKKGRSIPLFSLVKKTRRLDYTSREQKEEERKGRTLGADQRKLMKGEAKAICQKQEGEIRKKRNGSKRRRASNGQGRSTRNLPSGARDRGGGFHPMREAYI